MRNQETQLLTELKNLATTTKCLSDNVDELVKVERSASEPLHSLLKAYNQANWRQVLQWAYNNAEAGSFEFQYMKACTGSVKGEHRSSPGLVRKVLLAFMQGDTIWISSNFYTAHTKSFDTEGERMADLTKRQAAFQDQLVDQIHGLIGRKPRFGKAKDCYGVETYYLYLPKLELFLQST